MREAPVGVESRRHKNMDMAAIQLSAPHFPLHSRFEDLEQPARGSAFGIDGTKCTPPTPMVLRSFLQAEEENPENICFSFQLQQGFNFIEGSYMALKWSKMEHKVLKLDILSRFLTIFLQIASAALKHMQTSAAIDMRKNQQNNLRVCIYFLSQCICITEDNLHAQAQQSKASTDFESTKWLGMMHGPHTHTHTHTQQEHFQSWLILFLEWLLKELKTRVALLLSKLLQSVETIFDSDQDMRLAGELIRPAAVACLVYQKWGERRPDLKILKKSLVDIFSNSFLKPPSFAPEVAQETFCSLITICREHRWLNSFLVDLIEELLAQDTSVGISFLSRVVNVIVEQSNKSSEKEKMSQLQDDIESAMSIVADFAVRKDAIIITGLYLGRLLSTLRNDRATVRKYFSDIVGSCLLKINLLTANDQDVLAKMHYLLLRDRDATCRLRALANLTSNLKWKTITNPETFSFLFSLILERILDKSKIVRLKALRSLTAILMDSTIPTESQGALAANLQNNLQLEVLSKASKLLLLPTDSSYFCRQTLEAAGDLLCLPYWRGPAMFNYLDRLITSDLCPSSLSIASKVLHAHLNGYEYWVQFLSTRSEDSILKLSSFLSATIGDRSDLRSRLQGLTIEAFAKLKSHRLENLNNTQFLGSCMLISLFMSLEIFDLPSFQDSSKLLCKSIQKFVKSVPDQCESAAAKSLLIKWAFKALAMTMKSQKRLSIGGLRQIIQDQFVCLSVEGIEGPLDCVYNMKNPYGMVKKILNTYETRFQVINGLQPLKLLKSYISFLGDISRNYDLACQTFIKCLRDAQKGFSKSLNYDGSSMNFNYLQQEEQKAQEEDAVLRFAQMLLEGDSIPGCYVPFLKELAMSDHLHTSLRTAALQSFGQYLLANNHLAICHKSTVEMLLQSPRPQVKVAALNLTEKLMLAFPNDFLNLLSSVVTLLKDATAKDAAFTLYVHLMLEEKFKVEMLLGSISDGLCDEDQNIKSLLAFVLKKLLKDAKGPKYKIIINLYSHCSSREARERLVQVLVENSLDVADLESDELACLVLQILALGQNDAAYFASFLHPSFRSLQTLHSYLVTCPPKISLKGDGPTADYLVRFVTNYRRHKASSADKEFVRKLLEVLQMKAKKKKRSQAATYGDAKSMSVKEYEEAVESFKHCDISCCLGDLLKYDV